MRRMASMDLFAWSSSRTSAPAVGSRRGTVFLVIYHDPAPVLLGISDLGHANLGLRADVFVTDDRRLRNRARATAHELELGVVVAGVDEAVQAIAEVVEKGSR